MSSIIVDEITHSGNTGTSNLTLASNGNVTVAGTLSANSITGGGKLLRKTYLEIPRATFTQSYFPNDDTVPQITEGAEAWSGNYTPSTASCDLYISCTFTQAEASNVGDAMTSALFVSGTNDALQVRSFYNVGASTEHNSPVTMMYKMASWGTTQKTFSIRFGGGNCINYAWYTSGLATTLYSADACKTGFIIEEIST
tara:strand:+ start:157 stop:750 length:594 start_codon:yes stop_codon:yes gene_type:complete